MTTLCRGVGVCMPQWIYMITRYANGRSVASYEIHPPPTPKCHVQQWQRCNTFEIAIDWTQQCLFRLCFKLPKSSLFSSCFGGAGFACSNNYTCTGAMVILSWAPKATFLIFLPLFVFVHKINVANGKQKSSKLHGWECRFFSPCYVRLRWRVQVAVWIVRSSQTGQYYYCFTCNHSDPAIINIQNIQWYD